MLLMDFKEVLNTTVHRKEQNIIFTKKTAIIKDLISDFPFQACMSTKKKQVYVLTIPGVSRIYPLTNGKKPTMFFLYPFFGTCPGKMNNNLFHQGL